MALFTSTDLQTAKTAYLRAISEGIASASIAGEQVVAFTPDQWETLLNRIQQDLAGANPNAVFGMRRLKTIPGGAG